jgi:hypothetical protein
LALLNESARHSLKYFLQIYEIDPGDGVGDGVGDGKFLFIFIKVYSQNKNVKIKPYIYGVLKGVEKK